MDCRKENKTGNKPCFLKTWPTYYIHCGGLRVGLCSDSAGDSATVWCSLCRGRQRDYKMASCVGSCMGSLECLAMCAAIRPSVVRAWSFVRNRRSTHGKKKTPHAPTVKHAETLTETIARLSGLPGVRVLTSGIVAERAREPMRHGLVPVRADRLAQSSARRVRDRSSAAVFW